MTIRDSARAHDSKRNDFFLPEGFSYLNCAYMAPRSRAVEEAGIFGIRASRNPSEIRANDFFEGADAVRNQFAQLIGAPDPHHISISPSVSYAVATAARNIPLKRGDEIIVLDEQFPSHVYSWRRLTSEAGAELVVVEDPGGASNRSQRWSEKILERIHPKTVAVCIPVVHWTDGTLFNVEAIANRARDVGAFLIIDGTQSVGALPFNVARLQPDALICAGYKWLLGPYGTALAYWSDRFLDGVPIEENWITRSGSDDFSALVEYRDDYQPGAIRYDVGERSNFVMIPMLLEALKTVNRWNPEEIQRYCRLISEDAVGDIQQQGYAVETDTARAQHIFGIRAPAGFSLKGLQNELASRGISVSLRGSSIRVAPNMYNDVNDLSKLANALREYSPEKAR